MDKPLCACYPQRWSGSGIMRGLSKPHSVFASREHCTLDKPGNELVVAPMNPARSRQRISFFLCRANFVLSTYGAGALSALP